jgi:Sulfotransferase family
MTKGGASPDTAPFLFIVGYPRSGTTLLRAMFDSHPEMAIPWESYFLPVLWPRRAVYERSEGFDVRQFVADLANTSFRYWRLPEPALRRFLEEAEPSDYAAAARGVYRFYAQLQGKPRFGDKTPVYIMDVPMLAAIFAEARFLHLVRDGRDVALSLRDAPWGPNTVLDAAISWSYWVRECREAGFGLGRQRYCEIRYEDLVQDPEGTLRRLCPFAELDFDPAMLRYNQRAPEVIAPDPWPQSHQHLFLPPTPGLRDWRVSMKAHEVAEFERVASDLLEALGYEVVFDRALS